MIGGFIPLVHCHALKWLQKAEFSRTFDAIRRRKASQPVAITGLEAAGRTRYVTAHER
jgi:hypothetical protein